MGEELEGMEVIDDLLTMFSMRARIAFRGLACGRWGISGPARARLAFHLVVRGRCWVRVPDLRDPVELGAGALLIYRPQGWHLLSDSAATASLVMPGRIESLAHAEPGPHAGLVCGYFDGAGAHSPLLEALPDYLLWRGFEALPASVAPVARAACACADDASRAGEGILARLLEVLLQLVLREPAIIPAKSLQTLRAHSDPDLRRVLEALHAEPARRWTLGSLARRAGLSRSTFAERFRTFTGLPAMTYLRRHRLDLAERRIEQGLPLAQVARVMGFGSAASLRRVRRRAAREAVGSSPH
jgi:AraC-like DNA-binding protein